MIVLLGSNNQRKVGILQEAVRKLVDDEIEVVLCNVPSGITWQPVDLETTIQGSINRARNAAESFDGGYDLSVGMEGGLMMKDGIFHFIGAVTIFDNQGRWKTGKSDTKPLPEEVNRRVLAGENLGKVIREYYEKTDLDEKEKTDVLELIERKEGFTQAIMKAWEDLRG